MQKHICVWMHIYVSREVKAYLQGLEKARVLMGDVDAFSSIEGLLSLLKEKENLIDELERCVWRSPFVPLLITPGEVKKKKRYKRVCVFSSTTGERPGALCINTYMYVCVFMRLCM